MAGRSFFMFRKIFSLLLLLTVLPVGAAAGADDVTALPEGGFKSRWIWYPETPQDHTSRYFRKVFDLPEPVKHAEMLILVDDSGTPKINGQTPRQLELDQPRITLMSRRYDITGALRQGKNIITLAAGNGLSAAGVIMTAEITLASGKVVDLFTDTSWKTSQTAPDGWENIAFDDSQWLAARDLGDGNCTPWAGLSNAGEHFRTAQERAEYARRVAAMTDVSFLAGQSAVRAKLISNGTQVGLSVGDKIVAPILYASCFNPWRQGSAEFIRELAKRNINWVEYRHGLVKNMKPDGTYDFSNIDEHLNRILAINPEALLSLTLRFERSPEWWDERYPDELITYAQSGEYQDEQAFRFRSASFASDIWRRTMQDCLKAFMQYAAGQMWHKRLISVRISYGVYSEWHYYGLQSSMPDTGKAMTRLFRKYLRDKYSTNAALQAAWNDSTVTLENAQVPGAEARWGRKLYLRESTHDQRVLDYYACHSRSIADLLTSLAWEIKAADPQMLVGAYYGYTFGMNYGPEAHTVELERVLSDPAIDFLSSPYIYLDQRHAGNDGLMRTMPSVFRRHRKLMLLEDDTRTHLAGEKGRWEDAKNQDESVAILRRNLANCFLEGGGIQMLEFGSDKAVSVNWFNDPALLETLDKGRQIWENMFRNPPEKDKKIAVIYEPLELIRHGAPTAPLFWTEAAGDKTFNALHHSGAVFDALTLNDFMQSSHRYEMVIFLNLYTLNAADRAALKKKLSEKNIRRIVWTYAPGLVSEHGFSAEAMTELTGINLKYDLKGVNSKVLLGAAGKDILGYSVGGGYPVIAPTVYADDAQASVMGRYPDNRAAFVRKDLANGQTVFYSAVPITRSDIWKNIIADARIHIYGPQNMVIYADRARVMFHCGKAGTYTVALPRTAQTVVDLFENKVIGKDLSVFKLQTDKPQTWFLEMR